MSVVPTRNTGAPLSPLGEGMSSSYVGMAPYSSCSNLKAACDVALEEPCAEPEPPAFPRFAALGQRVTKGVDVDPVGGGGSQRSRTPASLTASTWRRTTPRAYTCPVIV